MSKYVLSKNTLITPKTAGKPPFAIHKGAVFKLVPMLNEDDCLVYCLTFDSKSYKITEFQAKDLIDRSKKHIEETD